MELIKAEVVFLVRAYYRDPFGFALRSALIETYAEYSESWKEWLRA